MRKNGFTLVELLAVIVVLAILITVATPNIMGLLNKEKDKTSDIVVNNLKDAAVSYAKEQISLKKLHLSSCTFEIKDENTAKNNISAGGKCVKAYSVNDLKNNGTFEDKQSSCDKNKNIYIYKYNNGNYDEIKAFVPDDACQVK